MLITFLNLIHQFYFNDDQEFKTVTFTLAYFLFVDHVIFLTQDKLSTINNKLWQLCNKYQPLPQLAQVK